MAGNSFEPLPWQIPAWKDKSSILLLTGAAAGGKALSLDTPIATLTGWREMKDLQVGDTVFSNDGQPTRIVAVSDIMYGHHIYNVVFDDGSIIKADSEHEWFTSTVASRQSNHRNILPEPTVFMPRGGKQNRKTDSVYTTLQIKDTLRTIRQGQKKNHSIENTLPLQFPEKDLPIPPYVLGAWLGDGHSAGGTITSADMEVIETIYSNGYEITKHKNKFNYGILALQSKLRGAGLLHNKHIPEEYLRASIVQRRELLYGLMDTDGTALPSGSVEFYNTNKILMHGVLELIISLGYKAVIRAGRAMLYGKDCGEKYRIKFTTDEPVFRLQRKLSKQVKKIRGNSKRRFIVGVVEVPSEPVRCIEVDSPSHLYLAGRSLIPTHNSRLAGEKVHGYLLKYPGSTAIIGRKDRTSANRSVVPFLIHTVIRDTEWGEYHKSEGLFQYNNGSQAWVVGLNDETQREGLRSIGKDGTVDLAWFEECNKLSLADHSEIVARMRGNTAGWRQIIYSTNPDGPEHWIKKLLIDGRQAKVFYSRPEDNPNNPQDYLDNLQQLVGVAHDRLWLGLWVQAEGAVYPEFDSNIHLVDEVKIQKTGRFIVSIDFGFTNPFSASLWYVDSEGIIWHYKQIYHTKRTVEEHCIDIKKMVEGLPVEAWITDHDAEDRATLEKHLGVKTIQAFKSVTPGIEAVKKRLKDNRIRYNRGAIIELDLELEKAKRPTCLTDEIGGYRWSDKKQDTPVKENDHALDEMRYLICYVDRIGSRGFTLNPKAASGNYIYGVPVKDKEKPPF